MSALLTLSRQTWTPNVGLSAVQVRKKFEALKKSKEAVQPDLDVADGTLLKYLTTIRSNICARHFIVSYSTFTSYTCTLKIYCAPIAL